MLGRQACSSSYSGPSKITCPLISFVSAGFESADSNHGSHCSFFSSPFWTIGRLSRLPRRTVEKSYDRGFHQIRNMGWKGRGLGVSGDGPREPLGVILRPGIPVLRRELLLGDSRDLDVTILRQQPPECVTTANRFSILPQLSISIFGQEFLALLDSGSEVTCISEDDFKVLSAESRIPTLPVSSTHLRGVTGQSPRIKMQAFLQFAIGKAINSSAIFLVVKNLVRPVILGMDWLLSVNASLDLHQSLLSLDSNGAQFSIPFHVDAVVCDPEASANVTCSALSVRGLPIQLAKSVTPLSVLKETVEAISSLTDSQRQD
jgi:hypothetical protein